MTNDNLLQLDKNLVSTWRLYSAQLEHYIHDNQIDQAIELIKRLDHITLPDNSSSFILFKALVYLIGGNYSKALEVTSTAFLHGFDQFWKFKKDSPGWVNSNTLNYRILAPLHNNPGIQSYVQSVHSDNIIPWGFDIAKTPFCSFRKGILAKSNARCYLSKKKLHKGEEVYQFRFFNGAFDIPTDPFYCDIITFDNNKDACENLAKYLLNQYNLRDYAFKISYRHPSINYFWNTLDRFNLHEILNIIASPLTHSSPFITIELFRSGTKNFFDQSDSEEVDRGIYFATGGEFINLLYVLTKCGFKEQILNSLSALPDDFALLLMCFNDIGIRTRASTYLGYSQLPELYDLALTGYAGKSPESVKLIVNFGSQNPDFRKKLANSLNRFEYHLYSNYRPGINWFFEPFECFKYAHGGGLLDFLVSEPDLIPALKTMKRQLVYTAGISNGVVDAYDNSLPFLYRTILLNSFLVQDQHYEKWENIPDSLATYERKQMRSVHSASLKTIEAWKGK